MTVPRQVAALIACGLALLAVAAAPPAALPTDRGAPGPATSAVTGDPARPPATARPQAPSTGGRHASPVAAPVTGPTAGSTPEPPAVPELLLSGAQAAAVRTAPLGPSVAGLLLLVLGGLVLVHRVRRKR